MIEIATKLLLINQSRFENEAKEREDELAKIGSETITKFHQKVSLFNNASHVCFCGLQLGT